MSKKKKPKASPAAKAKNKPAKPNAKPAVKKPAAAAPAKKPAKTAVAKSTWLDENANKPVIERYARRLGTFVDAMADGRVDADEVKAQETRLVKLMKEVEPMLQGELHGKVTQLLCELTAYDLMQILHTMEQARPKTVFRG